MDRRLPLFLLLVGVVVAAAWPQGASSAERPSAATGVITASNGTLQDQVVAAAPPAQGMDRERPDKSIAGAEVILGGFATAVFAIIFCYIRVTRRHAVDGGA